jgi:hypothetical protein
MIFNVRNVTSDIINFIHLKTAKHLCGEYSTTLTLKVLFLLIR